MRILDPPALGHAATRRWYATPLTVRLTAIIAALLVTGLAIAGATMVGILQAHLIGQVDAQLRTSAARLAATSVSQDEFGHDSGYPSNFYVHVSVAGARTWQRLPSQPIEGAGAPVLKEIEALEDATGDVTSVPTTISSSIPATAWRAQAVPVVLQQTGQKIGVVTVALPLIDVKETLNNTVFYLAISGLVLTLIGGFAAYYLVRLSLGQLRAIEVVAGKIVAGDLSERIHSLEPATTEVGSLARSLNTMLTRIEQLFFEKKRSEDKMRQFVSDASHELRTPLATLRGYGELYQMGGVPAADVDDVMERIKSEATRMGILVEDLLRLARMDERRPSQMSRVDIIGLARAAAMDLSALDPSRDVSLVTLDDREVSDELVCVANRDLLTQVFTNLVGNVVRYTPAGTPVELIVDLVAPTHPAVRGITLPTPGDPQPQLGLDAKAPGKVISAAEGPAAAGGMRSGDGDEDASAGSLIVIEMRDHGPGIPRDQRRNVFQRFYRVDDSRARTTGGTGLGLSIVAAVAQAQRGVARALETPGGGLTLQVVFPHVAPTAAALARAGSKTEAANQ